MKNFCSIFFIGIFIYGVNSGGITWPRQLDEFPEHRYISFSSECAYVSIKAREEASKTAEAFGKIVHKFDRGVLANRKDYGVGVLQPFVASYREIEKNFLDEIKHIFDIDMKKFEKVIRNFGVGAKGDYLCAYELYGEAVMDNIDFYEYIVKTLRHDLIGLPEDAKNCQYDEKVMTAVNETIKEIGIAFDKEEKSIDRSKYDHFIIAYNFVEAFEKACWRLSDKLVEIYKLDEDLWKDTLLYNGAHAIEGYLCAYGAYYNGENAHVDTYLRLISDIVQGSPEFKFDISN